MINIGLIMVAYFATMSLNAVAAVSVDPDPRVLNSPLEASVTEPYPAIPIEWIQGMDEEDDAEEKIYETAEVPPEFPGGEMEMFKAIANNLRYPQGTEAQGRVLVKFVVKKNGAIGSVEVAKSVDPLLDKEAVRVVKTLPRFTPGKLNGAPVAVWHTVSVTFRR